MNNVFTRSLSTPVLLLVFNRPATTIRVFEQIKKARPQKLFIAADGPRDEQEALLCAHVKDIVTHIDWACQVHTLFRDHNLGCGRAISSAITWFFEHVEEGIILEDDCVPDPTFFDYCQHLLERYRHNDRVMMVAGTSYLFNQVTNKETYFFAKHYSIWGWATWRRAWIYYDYYIRDWQTLRSTDWLKRFFDNRAIEVFWRCYFDRIIAGELDTWDIQWTYACIKKGALCAVPFNNLISNIGYIGAHANGKKSFDHEIPSKSIDMKRFQYSSAVWVNKKLNKKIYMNIGVIQKRRWWCMHKKIKRLVKQAIRYFGYDVVAYEKNQEKFPIPRTISPAQGVIKGRVLVSYLSEPITLKEDDERLLLHSNGWESREIVKIFNALGFVVDVINYKDFFYPNVHYDAIFDIYTNLKKFAPYLDKSTIKIGYVTGSYYKFQNNAEIERMRALEKRRLCSYVPKRIVGDEVLVDEAYIHADFLGLVGNEYILETFPEGFRSKISLLTISGSFLTQIKKREEFVPVNREFLWFFGYGAVHKGLDLVLEVFAKRPELTLNIVANIHEPDFLKIYDHELHNLPNIKVHGSLYASSERFREVVKNCVAFIAPSCSEAISSAVVTCCQVGLYPIVSRQTGVSLPAGCGLYLEQCSFAEIEAAVLKVHGLSSQQLIDQISQTQAFALEAYSRKQFSEKMRSFIQMCLKREKGAM
jgi:hypothetical protein